MAFVLDASVVLAWHFPDERWEGARSIAFAAQRERVVAPSYLGLEAVNGLLRGERMRRTDRAAIDLFLKEFEQLQIEHHLFQDREIIAHVLPLAREQGLKLFDAGYLHIASINRLPLATFDDKLVRAARTLNVALVGD